MSDAPFQQRGIMPSQQTASAIRALCLAHGDREVAQRFGQSRSAVVRMAARLPVNGSILAVAEALIPRAFAKL